MAHAAVAAAAAEAAEEAAAEAAEAAAAAAAVAAAVAGAAAPPQGSICVVTHMSPWACCTPAPSPDDLGGGTLGLTAAAAGPRPAARSAKLPGDGVDGVVATAGLLSRPLQPSVASSAAAEEGRAFLLGWATPGRSGAGGSRGRRDVAGGGGTKVLARGAAAAAACACVADAGRRAALALAVLLLLVAVAAVA